MFEDYFTTFVSLLMLSGIAFCAIVIPYMVWQHKVNKKALDALEALHGTRTAAH